MASFFFFPFYIPFLSFFASLHSSFCRTFRRRMKRGNFSRRSTRISWVGRRENDWFYTCRASLPLFSSFFLFLFLFFSVSSFSVHPIFLIIVFLLLYFYLFLQHFPIFLHISLFHSLHSFAISLPTHQPMRTACKPSWSDTRVNWKGSTGWCPTCTLTSSSSRWVGRREREREKRWEREKMREIWER